MDSSELLDALRDVDNDPHYGANETAGPAKCGPAKFWKWVLSAAGSRADGHEYLSRSVTLVVSTFVALGAPGVIGCRPSAAGTCRHPTGLEIQAALLSVGATKEPSI